MCIHQNSSIIRDTQTCHLCSERTEEDLVHFPGGLQPQLVETQMTIHRQILCIFNKIQFISFSSNTMYSKAKLLIIRTKIQFSMSINIHIFLLMNIHKSNIALKNIDLIYYQLFTSTNWVQANFTIFKNYLAYIKYIFILKLNY